MTRGRDAVNFYNIPMRGWLDIGWRVFQRVGRNRIGLIAAGVAFYGLLSLFPAITAAVAIAGLVIDPSVLVNDTDWLLSVMPEATAEMLTSQMTEVSLAGDSALGWAAIAALLLAFWSASKGMGSLIEGLNAVYEEREKRGFVWLRLLTIGLTICLIVALIALVTVVAAIPTILFFLGNSPIAEDLSLILRWPFLFFFSVAGIALLYRFGPSRRNARWRWLTPGAVLACTLWTGATLGFSYYVQSFASYNETFGAIGGVVVMLTWLWLSAYSILLGAQLDAEIEAQTRKDTTVGPERPMGERGATKADILGETFLEKSE